MACANAPKNKVRTLFYVKNAARKLVPEKGSSTMKKIGVIGTRTFVDQCNALAAKHGDRFRPPERLRKMADKGERFHRL